MLFPPVCALRGKGKVKQGKPDFRQEDGNSAEIFYNRYDDGGSGCCFQGVTHCLRGAIKKSGMAANFFLRH